jgi:hypothetical protein
LASCRHGFGVSFGRVRECCCCGDMWRRVPLTWSIECLQPHQRDLLQARPLRSAANLTFKQPHLKSYVVRFTSATAALRTLSRQRSASAAL